MSAVQWLAVVVSAALLLASTAEARVEVVTWSYVEPCSVDGFELRYGPGASSLDSVVDVGRPRQAGGHFSYELDVPANQDTWVCVAAIRDGATSDCSNVIVVEASSVDELRPQPAPDASERTWCDDFSDGSLDAGWVSTGPDESLEVQPELFRIHALGGTNGALVTAAAADDIHSHFLGMDENGTPGSRWSAYEYAGQMRFGEANTGVGVTLYSLYNSAADYYRLARHPASDRFVLERSRTDPSWRCIQLTTPVSVDEDRWYAFRIRTQEDGAQATLLAKLWPATASEPAGFQMSCSDARPDRQAFGAVGVWAAGSGARAWDSLNVSSLDPPDDSDPLGVPGTPELVLP